MADLFHSHLDKFVYKYIDGDSYIFLEGWSFTETASHQEYEIKVNGKVLEQSLVSVNRKDVADTYKLEKDQQDVGFRGMVHLNERINSFELSVESNSNRYLIINLKKKQLEKIESRDPIESKLELLENDNGNFMIIGWAFPIGYDYWNLSIWEEKDKQIDCDIQRIIRKDLALLFQLNNDSMDCGFSLKFKGNPEKKYYLKVEYGDKESFVELSKEVDLKDLTNFYMHGLNFHNIKSGLRYLRNNGIQKFVKRIFEGPEKKDISYNNWFDLQKPNDEELNKQRETKFVYSPKISLIVATYNTADRHLKAMIESVLNQTYINWELCIADGSDSNNVEKFIIKHYSNDNRIKYKKLSENLGISDNMNAALDLVTGEYVGLFDHDDLLTPDALFEIVSILQERKYPVIYTDEDKIDDATGELMEPHFKPDMNIDLLLSENYICHFLVVSKSLIDRIGMMDKNYDGAQDYDFVLRCVETVGVENVYHIPKALYHWRKHAQSTASNPESKLYAFEAGKRAIQAYYDRNGIDAEVEMGSILGFYRTRYAIKDEALISILIPNKDHIDDLKRCITSIENKSAYKNYEFIIIENNSELEETFKFYDELEKNNKKVKVVYWDGEFNYSAINNFGAKYANGEYILLLNNDTEIVNEDCLKELVSICQREDVGCVGARLLYEDDTIQHAGVIVGLGGVAGHCFIGEPKDSGGYYNRILCIQDYSAVTAACMMIKTSVFRKVNGLSEDLKVAFNDIDLCLKIRELGYLVVYNPYAELYHFESKSRGLENTPEKVERFNREVETFKSHWKEFLDKGDPCYNPNLSLTDKSYALKRFKK